jgi:hypothetical protein
LCQCTCVKIMDMQADGLEIPPGENTPVCMPHKVEHTRAG